MKTAQEYREKVSASKRIVLPSGLECMIRPVPTMNILELTRKAEEDSATLDSYMRKNFTEALNAVVPSSVVSPNILPAREAGDVSTNEDALFLDELVIGDLNDLFVQIVKISGIEAKEIKRFESFPANASRAGGGPSSRQV